MIYGRLLADRLGNGDGFFGDHLYMVSGANDALSQDLRPEASTMEQPLDHRFARDSLQMIAGFAEPYTADPHISN